MLIVFSKKNMGGPCVKNEVSLVKLQDYHSSLKVDISSALDLIGFKLPSLVNTIVLKVNLCYYWNASTGQTTDPAIVSALIDYLRENYGHDVVIKIAEADASAMQTKYAFPLLGYKNLAEQKKVQLLNLSADEIEEKEVTINSYKITLKVPMTLLRSDLFINMPKIKVMRATHITCAMKNLFGAIAYPRKVTYHPHLAETIVGINKILRPHVNIVDGLVALGKYPVRLSLIMAGDSTFSVDWVAAQVMGYNPSRIKFLNLAVKEKLGRPGNIIVKGERIAVFSKDFPTENNMAARIKMRLQFSLLRTYSRISGDIIPPYIDDN
jgi:uncharacterized protein (DUF362 family)